MEDKEIIALYWDRDERALCETEKKFGRYCYTIARNILGNDADAEECVNDAYMNAWNAIPPHSPTVLSAFLGKLTRCVCLKRWRAAHTVKRGGGQTILVYEELSECIADRFSVEDACDAAQIGAVIDMFLMSLSHVERRIFVCRYWYLDSVESISRRFGFSDSKVKSMLRRTRIKLRAYLQKEGVLDET